MDQKYLYEDSNIAVYDNGSGEIFVQPKRAPKATIRISGGYDDLSVTCHDGTLIPGSINGFSCFYALPGKVKIELKK